MSPIRHGIRDALCGSKKSSLPQQYELNLISFSQDQIHDEKNPDGFDVQQESTDREDLERLLGNNEDSDTSSDCDSTKKSPHSSRTRDGSSLLPKEVREILQCMSEPL